MAEPLGELFVKIDADTKGLKKGLTSAETSMGRFVSGIQRHSRAISMAMIAMSLAIVGAMAVCLKAYAEEEKGIVRLRVAMKNIGLDYDANRESIEKLIDALQQKTAVADDAQRDSLASLIRITRDQTKAFDLLELSMDVALGTGKDLASATTLIMYALSGNWGMLERYIPAIKEAADEEAKWLLLRELFVGQAEEYGKTLAGQTQLMLHNIGDIKEAIGEIIATGIVPMTENISELIVEIKTWTGENTKIIESNVKLLGAIAGISFALGALGLALPFIIKGFGMLVVLFTALMGPIGLLVAGFGMIAFGLFKIYQIQEQHNQLVRAANILNQERLKYMKGEENQLLATTKAMIAYHEATRKLTAGQQRWLAQAKAWVAGQEERIKIEEELGIKSAEAVEAAKASEEAVNKLTTAYDGLGGAMRRTKEEADEFIRAAASAIGQWAETYGWTVAEALIPGVSPFAPGGMATQSYQHGGIVTRPTIARIGEAGPEAIIPLGEGLPVQVNIYGDTYGTEDLVGKIADGLGEAYMQRSRMRG